jgi:hypothetical protein
VTMTPRPATAMAVRKETANLVTSREFQGLGPRPARGCAAGLFALLPVSPMRGLALSAMIVPWLLERAGLNYRCPPTGSSTQSPERSSRTG